MDDERYVGMKASEESRKPKKKKSKATVVKIILICIIICILFMALFIIENYAGMTVENYTHANISEPIKVYSCDTFDIEVLGIEFDPNPDHVL